MSQESVSKKLMVHIIYPCFLCGGEYGTASGVLQHIKTVHGYAMIARPPGHRRPVDKHYDYESHVGGRWNVQHYGCPSCWFHAPKDLEVILEHVMNTHKPRQLEGFVPKEEDEVDELDDEQSDQENEPNNENMPEVNNYIEDTSNKENEPEPDTSNKENENIFENNEPKKNLSTFLKDEKDVVTQVCSMLIEMAGLFKKLTSRNPSQ
ncbi:unnamed protein product [Mucor hiemalis]